MNCIVIPNEIKIRDLFDYGELVGVIDKDQYYPANTEIEELLDLKNSPPLEDYFELEFKIIGRCYLPEYRIGSFIIPKSVAYGIELKKDGRQFLFNGKGLVKLKK